jgi:phosphatidate cytidylyltransferase
LRSDDDTRSEHGDDEDLLADWNLTPETSELPDWTDEPTGQIPASLIREHAEEASVPAPVWREESADWHAADDLLDPTLFGPEPDDASLGPIADAEAEDARPWEFDEDLAQPAPPSEPPSLSEPAEPASPRAPWDLDEDEALGFAPAEPVAPRARRGRAQRTERPRREERTAAPRRVHPDAPRRDGRDMRVAVLTGVIIAVLVLVTFNIGTVLAMALVTVLVALAAAEAYAAFRRAGRHPATLLGLVATVALALGAYNKGTQALGLVFALLFVFAVLWYLAGVEKADPIQGLGSTILVFAWVGVLGSFAALLLNPNLFPHRHGLAFLLATIILVVGYDIAALFIGSSVGRRPLAPNVSPNKTIEGLVGATVVTMLLSVAVVPMIHPWSIGAALTLGVLTAVLCPIGDLAESMIKRSLGLKDMGNLLPGHGGVLDRLDGMLFVLPATYFVVRAFHLG